MHWNASGSDRDEAGYSSFAAEVEVQNIEQNAC